MSLHGTLSCTLSISCILLCILIIFSTFVPFCLSFYDASATVVLWQGSIFLCFLEPVVLSYPTCPTPNFDWEFFNYVIISITFLLFMIIQ